MHYICNLLIYVLPLLLRSGEMLKVLMKMEMKVSISNAAATLLLLPCGWMDVVAIYITVIFCVLSNDLICSNPNHRRTSRW